ncbi:MAG: hypothetical protein IJE14_05780 [Clostridia bacterium]|nr:hypothetical protein [Clostridia bacterium]
MGNGFGLYPEVKLGGEAEFKQALSSINKDLNVLTSELKLSSAEFGNSNDSMTALTSKASILNERLEKQEEKVATTREALEKMKETYGENSDKVKDWQVKLNNAEAQLAKTRDEIDKNNKAIEELGKQEKAIEKIKNGFKELKEKAEKVEKKLEPVNKVLKGIGTVGSTAMKGVTAGVAGATAAVVGLEAAALKTAQAVFSLAQESASAGDEIDEASQRMNLSSDSYQKLAYAAQMSGVQVTTLETAAKKLESKGSNMDLSKAIKQVASIKDESERSAKAVELFGSKAAYEMGPMLAQGVKDIKALEDAAVEYGLVMDSKAIAASAAFNDSLDILTGTATTFKNNLVADMLPGITDVMGGITKLITGEDGATEQIEKGIEDIMTQLDTIIPTVLEKVDGAAEPIGNALVTLVGSAANTILDNSDAIVDTASNLISIASDTLLNEENLEKIIDSGIDLVVELGGGLLDATPTLIDAGFLLVEKLLEALLDEENMDDLTEAAVDITLKLGEGLIGATPELIEAAFKLAGSLVEALLNYDWSALGSRIWAKIKDSITGDAEKTAADGSHAIGMPYVPYDNYLAQLHEGERILTAAENEAYTSIKAMSANNLSREDVAALRSDLQAIANILNGGIPVDVNNPRDIGRAVKQSA